MTSKPTVLEAEGVWKEAQQALRRTLKPDLYQLWFAPIRATKHEGNAITLEVANEFCELWLQNNYLSVIRDALRHAAGQDFEITFIVAEQQTDRQPELPETDLQPQPVPRSRSEEEPRNNGQPPRELNFNPRNTFDTFVVGTNNHFAHAAATAVATSPGKSYNPLFLHGGVGLGKTHLLHAIGQYVTINKKNAKVVYLSCERFTNEYIDAIQNNQLARFRKKYRQTDVLLIDDVQFLTGKERIQEEFFHTFNALYEAHKQIVLTCDRPASEIQGLEQRLVTRFEWGLATDLQPPDSETRQAILRKKAASLGATLPDDVLIFLANRIRSNIRRLEGALIRVSSYASLTGSKLSIEVVEGLLRDVLHEEGRQVISIDLIQRRVAEHFDIRLADMTSKRRPENIAFPRQIAMFLARQMTESSLNVIGEAFGGRDHGTVLHACRLVKDRMGIDTQTKQTVMYLEKQLQR